MVNNHTKSESLYIDKLTSQIKWLGLVQPNTFLFEAGLGWDKLTKLNDHDESSWWIAVPSVVQVVTGCTATGKDRHSSVKIRICNSVHQLVVKVVKVKVIKILSRHKPTGH